jgi:hypothetical protein
MGSGKIHKRGLTSFFTLFGFLIMSITGLVLYIVPVGRVAYWITWELFGMTKMDWGNIHILSSILFIVAGGFHIYFNWKPLMNYFKNRVSKGVRLRRELAVSSVLSVWIIVSAIWLIPPLSYLLDFNAWIKETWITSDDYEPPFGHAELMSLETFAKKMEIDIKKATQELKGNGIAFESTEETLEDIGRNNDVSPMNIYLLIKKFEPAPEPEKLDTYTPESIEVEFSGTGFGNKSIASICERLGLDATKAVSRLTAAGIPANLDQTMKSAAESLKTEAIEIMKVLLIEGYTPKIEE